MTKDEMVGCHHRLHGHEFEQAPGVGDGQGSLGAAVHGVPKSQTRLSNGTDCITAMLGRAKATLCLFYESCIF